MRSNANPSISIVYANTSNFFRSPKSLGCFSENGKEQSFVLLCNRYVFAGSRSILIEVSIHKDRGPSHPLPFPLRFFIDPSERRCRMMSIIDKRIKQLYPISDINCRRIEEKLADFTDFFDLPFFYSALPNVCRHENMSNRMVPISNEDAGALQTVQRQ